jgi:hypothetical protein
VKVAAGSCDPSRNGKLCSTGYGACKSQAWFGRGIACLQQRPNRPGRCAWKLPFESWNFIRWTALPAGRAANCNRHKGSRSLRACGEGLWRQAVEFGVMVASGEHSPNAYLGGMEVPNVGRASSHGFPSTSAMCALQTRLTTNGHLATYFATRGQRSASQFLLSASGSNSGPRLFVSITAPAPFRSI